MYDQPMRAPSIANKDKDIEQPHHVEQKEFNSSPSKDLLGKPKPVERGDIHTADARSK